MCIVVRWQNYCVVVLHWHQHRPQSRQQLTMSTMSARAKIDVSNDFCNDCPNCGACWYENISNKLNITGTFKINVFFLSLSRLYIYIY